MLQLDQPRTVAEILQYFSLDMLERTVRQKGRYYYRNLNASTEVRCHFDGSIPGISMMVIDPLLAGGWRTETLAFNMKTNGLVKQFKQTGRRSEYGYACYQMIFDEDEHFQAMLFNDKFFPEIADVHKIVDFADVLLHDVETWDKELYGRKKERYRENWQKYGQFLKNFKCKKK